MDGGGTTPGAGQGTGLALWANMLPPIATVVSRASSATLKILVVVSKPLILKLLPSSCKFNFVLFAAMGKLLLSSSIPAFIGGVFVKLFGKRIVHPHKVLQESRQRFAAVRSHCGNLHQLVRGLARMIRIFLDRVAISVSRMTIWR